MATRGAEANAERVKGLIEQRKMGSSLLGSGERALVDRFDELLRRLAIDSAANGAGGAENLLDGARKVLRQRALAHLAGDAVNVVDGEVAVVQNVLLSLAIACGLLERLNEKRGGRRHDFDGALTVLDQHFARHLQALPVLCRFLHIIADLLRRL